MLAVYALGLTKCVPLKVERKLYSATLFVRFTALNLAVTLYLSVWKRLSKPMPASNMCRGAIRGGFLSSFSVPSAGIITRSAPRLGSLQLRIGAVGVAYTPPQ